MPRKYLSDVAIGSKVFNYFCKYIDDMDLIFVTPTLFQQSCLWIFQMMTHSYENIFYPFVCIKDTKVSFKFSANVIKLAFMEIKQTLHGLALQ